MPKVPENDFNRAYNLARKYANECKNWRWGQCIFNAYHDVFPEIANQVRGTKDDCFYNDKLVPYFLSHFEVEYGL